MSDFLKSEIEGLEEAANLLVKRMNLIRRKLAIATDANEEFKYQEQLKTLEEKLKEIKQKLADLGFDKNRETVQEEKRLEDHHQFTCNRNAQDEAFFNYVYPSDGEQATSQLKRHHNLHFFFLYGSSKHEQFGLYQRFCNTLAGRDRDFSSNYQPSAISIEDIKKIQFPKHTEEASLQKGMIRELLKSLAIEDHEMEPLLEKNLAFALNNSPRLFELTDKDKICVFIRIPGNRWDKTKTPKITKWFIEEFCLKGFPKEAPHFFFFFSVDYRNKKAHIKEEVELELEKAEYIVKIPELGMVEYDDIEDWFDTYEKFWQNVDDVEATKNKHFDEEEDDEMYMQDVQFTLKTIIDEINNPTEKRTHRGRGNY